MVTPAPSIAVIDYGIGNLRSAEKALQRVAGAARLSSDQGFIRDAQAVVLPGVGAFGSCMHALRTAGLEASIHEAVGSGRPFLGICVGMQMLFDSSEEDPGVRGLGVIPGTIDWIPPGLKRPQMQWNQLVVKRPDDPMLRNLERSAWMYFVHSLHGVPNDPDDVVATCDYGPEPDSVVLNAAFRRANVFATQFHPEKSGSSGLTLLGNFVAAATSPSRI